MTSLSYFDEDLFDLNRMILADLVLLVCEVFHVEYHICS
jgi:hypothetical protein